ncbi:hypothetical protein [Treponema primitia]|uniref:hypothetical protein n=1 Tax=Treponema primitia TaxID=88058 RepID=UPI000255535F|nr:hypothetical protein [Treponema primitia]
MSDLIPGNGNYTPTNVLAKQGVTAVGGIAGGVVLMIIRALPSFLGIIAGLVVGVVGLGGVLSKDPDDRKPGLLAAAAGGLAILSRAPIKPISALSGTLLGISALGLLVMGIWNGIKFIKGLKGRS